MNRQAAAIIIAGPLHRGRDCAHEPLGVGLSQGRPIMRMNRWTGTVALCLSVQLPDGIEWQCPPNWPGRPVTDEEIGRPTPTEIARAETMVSPHESKLVVARYYTDALENLMPDIGQRAQRSKGLAIALALFALLGGCDERDSAQTPNKMVEEVEKETVLMADPERAGSELEQRLMAKVSSVDGLLFVNNNGFQLFVLPANAPWVIDCGLVGISITFGNSVSGSDGDVSNDVEIDPSHKAGSIKRTVPSSADGFGKRLLAILGQEKATR